MKKDLYLLGSTGSIGNSTLKLIRKDKKNFSIKLLTTNTNVKKILKQALEFNVKKIVIFNKKKFYKFEKKFKRNKISVYFSIEDALKKNKRKSFLTINAISGIDGLEPSINIIKHTRNLAIANKESIICGWKFLNRELTKNNTNFIPLDSEHFSIWSLLKSENIENVKSIYLTASGGPFLNRKLENIKNIKPEFALKHPNWKMGKKISIDSATMMNKVFEVIEAKKLFNLNYKNISILTHPKSYVHAIVKFKNALIKILIHEPDMKIPIYNSLYPLTKNQVKSKKLNLSILNNLDLKKINYRKFPLLKLLNNLNEKDSLYETILVVINDFFVLKYLNNEIKYHEMIKLIYKYSNYNEFLKYRKILPKKVTDIYKLRDYVSLKLSTLSV